MFPMAKVIPIVQEGALRCGSVSELARRLGRHRSALLKWTRVPANLVVAFEAATGIDRERARPDLYFRIPSGDSTNVRSHR